MSETLAERIGKARAERGMSKRKFAELIGVHPAIISFIENGERKPSVRVGVKLADVLNLSADELLQILNEPKRDRDIA